VLLALGLASLVQGPPDTRAGEPMRWSLVFSDEFDGARVDSRKWSIGNPLDGIINHELQAYVPEAVGLRAGALLLTATRHPTVYRGASLPFRSGTVTTFGKFAFGYGRVEVRAKLPAGTGLWPAFWLLPESLNWPPEIDLFEVRGDAPGTLHQTLHWRDPEQGPRFDTARHLGPDLSAGFHVYRLDWRPDAILWYLDGIESRRATRAIPAIPMYLNAALAVGGDFPGPPDESTPFPAMLEIDYVRVYRWGPDSPAISR
jgi:beta-glucanase (GH16 family)